VGGAKVELKNLNSFRALRSAIEHEQREQPGRYLASGVEMAPGTKSTRGWDDARGVTVLQREKEEAHDYRYFPDPDLTVLEVDTAWVERVRAGMPELPRARAARYRDGLGLPPADARALVQDRALGDLFDRAVEAAGAGDALERERGAKIGANILLQQCKRLANERGVEAWEVGLGAEQLAGMIALREAGEIGSSALDPLVEALAGSGESARDAAERLGLIQVSDEGALEAWCREVVEDGANAGAVEDVRAGKQQAIGRLIGGVMQKSGGKADAKRVREILMELIGG